jgi:hypothetical protein
MDWKRYFSLNSSRNRAIILLRVESLMILALVLYLLIAPLLSSVTALESLGAEIVFGFLGSAGLWLCARGFKEGKSFGRAPAVLANLIALGVSYYMIQGNFLLVGIPLAVLALVTLVSAALGYKE